MAPPSKVVNIAGWIISALLCAGFVFVGFGKWNDPAAAREGFIAFGLPGGLALFIGTCEIAGGIGVLIPRLAAWAAAGLTIIMIGAAYSHISSGIGSPLGALGAGAFAVVLFFLRRSSAILIGSTASGGDTSSGDDSA